MLIKNGIIFCIVFDLANKPPQKEKRFHCLPDFGEYQQQKPQNASRKQLLRIPYFTEMHAKLKPSWKMKANRHDNLGTLSGQECIMQRLSTSVQIELMCLLHIAEVMSNDSPTFLTAHSFTLLDSKSAFDLSGQ